MPCPRRVDTGRTGSLKPFTRWLGWALTLWLLPGWVFGQAQPSDKTVALQVPVRIELLDAGLNAHLSVDGKGVVLPSDGRATRFRLHFELPGLNVDQSPWQLRFNRAAIDELALQAEAWHPSPQSYYRPSPHDGLLPMAFVQGLPGHWSGVRFVDVTARGDQLATLRPQVMRMALGVELDKRNLAIAMALYAAIIVLALVALSLFFGIREIAFLSFMVFMASSLLLMLTMNGHAYTLPMLSWMTPLGARGINIATLLVCATGIAVARDYAGKRPDNQWLRRVPAIGAMAILCVALFLLAGFAPGPLTTQYLVTACWVVAAILSLMAFVSAMLRKAWLGWPLLVAVTILGITGTLFELSVRGMVGEFWGRFGYQIGLVFIGLVLVVALIGRIADFRIRHARERSARQASESRLEQQEAYVALTDELREHLPNVASKDMEWRASQMAMARLLPLLKLSSATILLYRPGYDPIVITEPVTQTSRLGGLIAANAATLRAMAQREATVADLQLEPAANPGTRKYAHAYAALPLSAGSGGVGLALLERAGMRSFTKAELALVGRFGTLIHELTAEARANHSLRRAAELDVLTGILNRNAIDTALARHFTAAFQKQQPLAILFVDMDHFKSVNDSRGHACGDHCLQQLAHTLRSVLGPDDVLGRYGGEEFMVVLPAQDERQALRIAEQLRERMESSRVQWQEQGVPLTVSVGVAVRLPQEQVPTAALERADRALYAAKHGGRNRVNMGR